ARLVAAPRPRLLWAQDATEVTAAAFSRTGRLAVARKSSQAGIGLVEVMATGPLADIRQASAQKTVKVTGVDVTGAGIKLAASISSDHIANPDHTTDQAAARVYSAQDGKQLLERIHPG